MYYDNIINRVKTILGEWQWWCSQELYKSLYLITVMMKEKGINRDYSNSECVDLFDSRQTIDIGKDGGKAILYVSTEKIMSSVLNTLNLYCLWVVQIDEVKIFPWNQSLRERLGCMNSLDFVQTRSVNDIAVREEEKLYKFMGNNIAKADKEGIQSSTCKRIVGGIKSMKTTKRAWCQ